MPSNNLSRRSFLAATGVLLGSSLSTSAQTDSTPWLQVVGPDYLLQAFKVAREADPNVALHYNDYNIERGPRHRSSLLLLKRLISDGAPITTLGIQGHWSVPGMTKEKLEDIDQAIEDYRTLKRIGRRGPLKRIYPCPPHS